MGITFLIGIFFAWYVIGEVGLAAFGAIALSVGTFGIAPVIANAVTQSMGRELAAAYASREPERIKRTIASLFVFSCFTAGLVLFIICGLSAMAWFGILNVSPELRGPLAALFLSQGAIMALKIMVMPFTLSIYANQFIGIHNMLIILTRSILPLSAVLAFSVLNPDGTTVSRLYTLTIMFCSLHAIEVLITVVIAKFYIQHLTLQLSRFDRKEFRTIATTVLRTGWFCFSTGTNFQIFSLLINLLFGLTYNGMWAIAIRVMGHLHILAESALTGIDSMAAHLKEQGQGEAIAYLMARVMRYQLVIAAPIAFAYIIFVDPILHLWIGGQLELDENIKVAGLSVDTAIRMVVIMSIFNLLSEVCRSSARGVERILYGMGHISSYIWFAKWSFFGSVGAAYLLMLIFDTPVVAPIPLILTQFLYFDVVILRTAARKTGTSVSKILWVSLPRPLLILGLMTIPLLIMRSQIESLTLVSLIGLLAGIGLFYAVFGLFIGMTGAERTRLRMMARGAWLRFRQSPGTQIPSDPE